MQIKKRVKFPKRDKEFWNEYFALLPRRTLDGTLFWLEWGFRKVSCDDDTKYLYMTYDEYAHSFGLPHVEDISSD